ADYERLMTMTEALIAHAAREATGGEVVTFGDHQITLTPPYARLSLRAGAADAAAARLHRPVTTDDLRDRDRAAGIAPEPGAPVEAGEGGRGDGGPSFGGRWGGRRHHPPLGYDLPAADLPPATE